MYILDGSEVVEQSPYGILSPATNHMHLAGDEWVRASAYWTDSCAVEYGIGSCGETYDTYGSSGAYMSEYTPFEILTTVRCSTLGSTREVLRDLAVRQAQFGLQFALERELWFGSSGQNRSLTDSSAVAVNDIAVTNRDADASIGLLENALVGTTNPTIHIPRGLAQVLHLKEDNAGILRTLSGARVILGDGYGQGDDGIFTVAGTGMVSAYWGDSEVLLEDYGKINRNTIEFTVSTPAAVIWNDCRHYTISIDITK